MENEIKRMDWASITTTFQKAVADEIDKCNETMRKMVEEYISNKSTTGYEGVTYNGYPVDLLKANVLIDARVKV